MLTALCWIIKNANFCTHLSFLWPWLLINHICGNLQSADSSVFIKWWVWITLTHSLLLQDCIDNRGEFVGSACGPHGPYVPDVLFWSTLLFFSTVFMSAFLKEFKFSNYFPTKVLYFTHYHYIRVQRMRVKLLQLYSNIVQWCPLVVKCRYLERFGDVWKLRSSI